VLGSCFNALIVTIATTRASAPASEQGDPFGRHVCLVSRRVSDFERRWFKSGLCNQLFFPVNEFPVPCNHPNFLGEFVQADGWARLPVTPLNLVQVSCGELF
jgi:hypothetical protein